MKEQCITKEIISDFKKYLLLEERSGATVEKYIRDVTAFTEYLNGEIVTKDAVIAYKKYLQDKYAIRSVNSMIAGINCFFSFLGCQDMRVKSVKLQNQIYRPEEKELTKAEYTRLCMIAERNKNRRLNLIIQTICGTGIRVSELQFITVEAVKSGEATVSCKAKTRSVFIVKNLQKNCLTMRRSRGLKAV